MNLNIETIIEVFKESKLPYAYNTSIYGQYKMKLYTINGRSYFKKCRTIFERQKLGIWWSGNCWMIGKHSKKGSKTIEDCFAIINEDVLFPHLASQENKWIKDVDFRGKPDFDKAGDILGLRCKQANDWVQINYFSGKYYKNHNSGITQFEIPRFFLVFAELHIKLKKMDAYSKRLEKQIEDIRLKNSMESKQSYKEVEKLLSKNSDEAITFKSLQFSIMASNKSYNDAIVDAIIEGKNDSKRAINDALKIWHTDKFFQKFGHRIAPIEEAKIKEFVKIVTQALTMAK